MHHPRPVRPRSRTGQSPFQEFDSITQAARRPEEPSLAHPDKARMSGSKTAKAKTKAKAKSKKNSSRQTAGSAWQYSVAPSSPHDSEQAGVAASFPDPAEQAEDTSPTAPKGSQGSPQQDGAGRRRRDPHHRPLTSWRSMSALQGAPSSERTRPRHWSPSPERRKSVSFVEPQVREILRYSPEDPREPPRPKGLVNKALMKSWTKGFSKKPAGQSGGGSDRHAGVGASPLPFLKRTKSGHATPEAGSVSSVTFVKKKKVGFDKDKDKEGSVRSGGSHLSDQLGKLKANLHLRRSHAAAEPVMTGFVRDSSEFLSPRSPVGEGDTISLASYTSIESSASAAAAAARHRPTKHWKKKKHHQGTPSLGPADLQLRSPPKVAKPSGPVRAFKNMLGKNSKSTMDLSALERASVTGISRSYDDILKENNFPTQQEFTVDTRLLTLSRDCVEPGDFDDDAEYYRDFHLYYDDQAGAGPSTPTGGSPKGGESPEATGREETSGRGTSASSPPAVDSSVKHIISKYEKLGPTEQPPSKPRAVTTASFPSSTAGHVPDIHHEARATKSTPTSNTHVTTTTHTTTTTTTSRKEEEMCDGGVATPVMAADSERAEGKGKHPKATPRSFVLLGEHNEEGRAMRAAATRKDLLPATSLRPAVKRVEKNTKVNEYENLIIPPKGVRPERQTVTHIRESRRGSTSPPSSPPPPPPREGDALEKNYNNALGFAAEKSKVTENGRTCPSETHVFKSQLMAGRGPNTPRPRTTTTTTTYTSLKKTEGPEGGFSIPSVVITKEEKTRVNSSEPEATERQKATQMEGRQTDSPSHPVAQVTLSGSSNEDSGFLSSLHRLVRKTTSSSSTEDPQPSLKERLAKRLSSVSSEERETADSSRGKRKVPPERPPPPKLVCDKFNTYGHYLSADDPPLTPPSPPPPKPPRLFQILSGYRRPAGGVERLAGGSGHLHSHHNYRRYSLVDSDLEIICSDDNQHHHHHQAEEDSDPDPEPPEAQYTYTKFPLEGQSDDDSLEYPLSPEEYEDEEDVISLSGVVVEDLSPPRQRRPPSISPPPPPPPATPPPLPPVHLSSEHSDYEEEEDEEESKKKRGKRKKEKEDSRIKKEVGVEKHDSFTSRFPLSTSHDLAATPASEYDMCGTCSGHSSWSFGTDEQYEKTARETDDTYAGPSGDTTSRKKDEKTKIIALRPRYPQRTETTTSTTSAITTTTTTTRRCVQDPPWPRARGQAVLTHQVATRELSPNERERVSKGSDGGEAGDTEGAETEEGRELKDSSGPTVTKRSHYFYEKNVKATPRRGDGRLSGLASKKNYKTLSRSLEDSLASSSTFKSEDAAPTTRLRKHKWKSLEFKGIEGEDGMEKGKEGFRQLTQKSLKEKPKGILVEDDFVEKLMKRSSEMKVATSEASEGSLEVVQKTLPSVRVSVTREVSTSHSRGTLRPDPAPRMTVSSAPSPVPLPRCTAEPRPLPAPRITKPSSAPTSRPSSALSFASDRPLVSVFFEKLLESQNGRRTSTPRLGTSLSRSEAQLTKDAAKYDTDGGGVEDVRSWKMKTSLDSSTFSDSPSVCESYKSESYLSSYPRQVTSPTSRGHEHDLRRSVSCDRIPPAVATFPEPRPRQRPRPRQALARSDALIFSSDEDVHGVEVGVRTQGQAGVWVRRASDSILTGPEGHARAPTRHGADTGYTGDTEDDEEVRV